MFETLRKWFGQKAEQEEDLAAPVLIAEKRSGSARKTPSSNLNQVEFKDVQGPWLRGGVAPGIDLERVRKWTIG